MGVHKRVKTPNTWVLRWYERDAAGVNRQQWVTFHGSRKEAVAEHGRLVDRSLRGKAPTQRGKMLFSAFCDLWLAQRKEHVMSKSDDDDDISPHYWMRLEQLVRCQIKPVLGEYKIGEIGPKEIDDAKTSWRGMKQKRRPHLEESLSRRTVHHVFSTVRKILNDAVMWKYIDENPCKGVLIPKKGSRSLGSVPIEAACKLLDHDSLEPVHVAAVMALLTGLRRGELLALAWDDIDLEAGFVFVEHATTQLLDDDATMALKDVKTGASGRRAVPLAPMLQSLLKAYRAAHPQALRRVFFPGGSAPRYDVIWRGDTYSSALRNHLAALGIAGVSIQRLRHAFNSLGNLAGSNEAARASLMGHILGGGGSASTMTRGQYTTIYAQQATETIALLEQFLKGKKPE